MEEIIYFHDSVLVVLCFILLSVWTRLAMMRLNSCTDKIILERHALEFIWTLLPALVIFQVALPSLSLIYLLDDVGISILTIKVIGHQWYWRYEYSDFWLEKTNSSIEFDSYILRESELSGEYRLLEVDNRPTLPYKIQTRVLVSRGDVLHSWTLPSLGIKADANPGRLNQLKFLRNQPGVIYGQCSEICGANHRFIPIALEFIRVSDFIKWIINFNQD